jgi:hypothetical protein
MTFSVTVRNEDTGETVHLRGVQADDAADAIYRADAGTPVIPELGWLPGPAPVDFYQVDPELDSFSYEYFGRLEDAQEFGLRLYRQHCGIMEDPATTLVYIESPLDDSDPDRKIWNIVNYADLGRHITMFQIVKYSLTPSAPSAPTSTSG